MRGDTGSFKRNNWYSHMDENCNYLWRKYENSNHFLFIFDTSRIWPEKTLDTVAEKYLERPQHKHQLILWQVLHHVRLESLIPCGVPFTCLQEDQCFQGKNQWNHQERNEGKNREYKTTRTNVLSVAETNTHTKRRHCRNRNTEQALAKEYSA